MVRITYVFGIFLIVLGVVALIASGGSPTAGIPAGLGLIFTAAAWFASRRESARKAIMHGLMVLGLVALLAALSRVVPALTAGGELGLAAVVNLIMAVASLIYLAFGVNSFVQARRQRTQTA